ncbi:WxL domain-containing protein [Lactiplantibacillus daowaiensis]|uniref:WxL domain-containing protein n=1 Tax=Lactiplantibacillus daowaiensis TaxID=2559918 RepID=A0ABW1S1Y9_9LACO|nr:WxL domain-containing protein [Lactiplantibacillus daowaiensis]
MKQMLGSVLVSGALLLSAMTPMVAHAENTSNASTTGDTKVTASFTGSTSTIDPVDPNNPDTSVPGGDGNNGAAAGGGLSLIYVTNQLDFGTHQIDVLNATTIPANYVDSSDGNNSADTSTLWNNKAVFEVSDVRGTNAGWHLDVSAPNNLKGDDGSIVKGATLTLGAGTLGHSGADANNVTTAPIADVLDGTSNTLMAAAAGDGAGVTVDQIDPSNIQLTIPANSVKAQGYTTTLNWNLADTPQS